MFVKLSPNEVGLVAMPIDHHRFNCVFITCTYTLPLLIMGVCYSRMARQDKDTSIFKLAYHMDIKPILTLSRYYLIGLSCCTFFDKLLFFKYEKPLFWWTVLGVNKFKSRGSLWMQQRRIIIIMRTIQTILVFHFQLIKFWTTFCDREEIFDGIMDSCVRIA